MTVWNTILQDPIWQYDSDPPDPGGAQSALWQTGTNGIRTNQSGDEIYMNVRHKTLQAPRASVPSELNKTYLDTIAILKYPQSNKVNDPSGFSTTWSPKSFGTAATAINTVYHDVRVTTTAAGRGTSKITLFNSFSSHFVLGTYRITFDVKQHSGESINSVINSTSDRVEVVTRDSDEVADGSDKNRFAVSEGFNSIVSTLFDDGSTSGKPSVEVIFHKDAIFDITISNIRLKRIT